MTNEERQLERLGKVIGDDLGTGASAERLRRQRQGLLALSRSRRAEAPRKGWIAVAALAAVLVIGIVTWRAWPGSQPLAYTVGDAIRFEDGSRLEVAPGATVHVTAASYRQVDVALDEGSVRSSIHGNGVTRWILHAGVFQVVVVGTVFTVEWDQGQELLDVWVEEGIVRVGAEDLAAFKEQEVVAGRHLQANGRSGAVLLEPWRAATEPDDPVGIDPLSSGGAAPVTPEDALAILEPAQLPAAPEALPEGLLPASAPPGHSARQDLAPAEWVHLYESQRCKEAIDEAERAGFDALLQGSIQGELWQLADAARCAGRSDLAARTLRSYRDRFDATDEARIAAYLLGRTALEQQDDPAAAVAWFQTYLDEAPEGPLAEEALGRLMLASGEAGLHDRAEESARQYLDRFPTGSFASLARSIVER